MDRYTVAKAKMPAAFAPAEDRDWCATCARRPCRRYAVAQRSGKRWCAGYEYANREVPDERR